MEPLTAAEIRRRYLEFFAERGHAIYPSDSLVPANDPTLLFTGAGMNQFKDMFLGKGALPDKRVTTSQKCLRVPDLDNVGLTPRHHTFFEMLGNFSFGDYFKDDCIPWEWEFFKDVCGIPAEQMVVTIYRDDEEAFEIWTQRVGLSADRVFRFDEKENFWPAEAPSKGPNGPCGPCSEIYFDARPGDPYPDREGLEDLPADRFTEIGNCVFTQFDRQGDGSLLPLPQKNIDVGLGLERIAAVLQGAPNNFETELFQPFLQHLATVSGNRYGEDEQRDIRMRRIADHVRAVTFCIADGALPGNEGRGYVVRKILRRAARDGFELGLEKPFLFDMVEVTGEVMGDQYPEVRENAAQCRAIIKSEEEGFLTVYRQGMVRLQGFLADAGQGGGSSQGPARPAPGSGEFAFTLHDTYGFPVDITQKVMEEHGLLLDEAEFEAAMAAQRARARASMATADAVFTASVAAKLRDAGGAATEFVGYDSDQCRTQVQALIGEGDELLDAAKADARVVLVAAATPFYAQGGGQVGDRGVVKTASGEAVIANTTDQDGFHLHEVMVTDGHIEAGQDCELLVDEPARRATERNHTATHLLHAALKQVLGDHVSQAGSEVAPERLRFDYTQPEKPSSDDLQRIEDRVNEQVLQATPVQAQVRQLEEARAQGFVALFGEKYGKEVRTLQVGDFSKELCGGTHVHNSGNIGTFRITSETAISAGTRRLEAVTGPAAAQLARSDRDQLAGLAGQLKIPVEQVATRVGELSAELKKLRKDLDKALAPDLGVELDKLRQQVVEHDGVHTVVFARPGMNTKDCQELAKRAQQALAPLAAVILSPASSGQVAVVASVSKDLTDRLAAGDLVKAVTGVLGGGGGGRPEMAQGKGSDAGRLPEAVEAAVGCFRTAGLAVSV
ncbi:MAG: alanine--tRNA ligase [Planctomycetota bacterium]|nr:alanine--tRNA ligase [Planctomycetota bacterium]